ncbi:MAG: hypothetical protein E7069_03605 [Bacteroidales bacterium]|nr:hypothetical protein [Bacteroidales bacterium]
MARTIEEIKEAMTTAFMRDSAAQSAYGFGENQKFSAHFSKASIESILFYVFAVCAYAIERLTETHLTEVTSVVAALRPHTLTWYQQKALAFRYGEAIDDATADYTTDETSDTEKPVSQCAVNEADTGGLVIKVATTDSDGNLTYLPSNRLSAFSSYIGRIKDAGIQTTILSQAGDRLTLKLVVYVDDTMYNTDGTLISEPSSPIQTAIKEYLKQLPFNGELVLEHLTDYLQTVDGVEVPHIVEASSTAVSATGQTSSGYGDAKPIDVRVMPGSGYFVVSFDATDSWHSTIEYRIK